MFSGRLAGHQIPAVRHLLPIIEGIWASDAIGLLRYYKRELGSDHGATQPLGESV